jgi:hypothetical protein
VLAKRIANVAFYCIELVQCVVLDGIDIGKLRDRRTGTETNKYGPDRERKQNFTEGWWLGAHLNFQDVWIILEKLKC